MADSIKIYEGTTLTSAVETTVTTVTASKTLLVKGAILANNYTSSATHLLKFGTSTIVIPAHTIAAQDALNISWEDNGVPITAGGTIKFTPSVTTGQTYYIWGVQIDA